MNIEKRQKDIQSTRTYGQILELTSFDKQVIAVRLTSNVEVVSYRLRNI